MIAFLIVGILNFVATDPSIMLSGDNASPKQIAELREYLGLNTPLIYQVIDLLKSILTFNLGNSWASNEPITDMLKYGLKVSLIIALPSFIISNLLALSISVICIFSKKIYRIINILCIALMSISSIPFIMYFQWLISYKLKLLPISGYSSRFPQGLLYLILPISIWILLHLGSNIKLYYTLFAKELKEDYIKTSYSKGLGKFYIFFFHILKNVSITLFTKIISQLPSLVLGALLIENFFSLPGIGSIVFTAINNSDFPIIKAITSLSAFLYIFINTFLDIMYIIIDPKIRLNHKFC